MRPHKYVLLAALSYILSKNAEKINKLSRLVQCSTIVHLLGNMSSLTALVWRRVQKYFSNFNGGRNVSRLTESLNV